MDWNVLERFFLSVGDNWWLVKDMFKLRLLLNDIPVFHANLFNRHHHNYNKILKSDWLSTPLISALIGQYASCLSNWTVRAITRALTWLFFTAGKKKRSWNFLCFDLYKEPYIS